MRPFSLVAALIVAVVIAIQAPAAAASGDDCGGFDSGTCGVTGSASHFHGLIAVDGAPWLFDAAAHSGTEAGCGDCSWTLVLACLNNSPGDPTGDDACTAALQAAKCQ